MWIAFDIYFIYLLTKDALVEKYWFTIIPLVGVNLLKIWTSVFAYLKDLSNLKTEGYVLTNKAFYHYQNGKVKDYKKINLKNIDEIKKSEYIGDGFFVISNKKSIKVNNIDCVNELILKFREQLNKE